MIIVTQGHERGIGLEVFFKSILVSNSVLAKQTQLIAYRASVEATLKSLNVPYQINNEHIEVSHRKISVLWLNQVEHSESFTAIKKGMELCEQGRHILFTLPTSKDQFPGFSGHTEYFRSFYQLPELGMFFLSNDLKVLLLSDHIPLREVPLLSEEIIIERIQNAIKQLQQWHWPIAQMLVAGINPHAGEEGLIGNEDNKIRAALKKLKSQVKFPLHGPIPGDTMLLSQKSVNDILVFPYHDQGLGIFKGLQGFIGANITLGLDYPRFSPDHGTSFSLSGQNKADYRGCAYALTEALKLLESVYGRNSSQQSTSSQS